jgi:hypothetical protein
VALATATTHVAPLAYVATAVPVSPPTSVAHFALAASPTATAPVAPGALVAPVAPATPFASPPPVHLQLLHSCGKYGSCVSVAHVAPAPSENATAPVCLWLM